MPKEKKTEKRQQKPKGKIQPQKAASRELSRDQLEELRRKLQKKYR